MALGAKTLLQVGTFAQYSECGCNELRGGVLARDEEEGGDANERRKIGHRSVPKPRIGELRHHVIAGLSKALFQIAGEAPVEIIQGVRRALVLRLSDHTRRWSDHLHEFVAIFLGHTQQVGNDEGGERLRVLGYDFTLAVVDESVDQPVRELLHVFRVLPQAFERQQPREQAAVSGVLRSIEGDEMSGPRHLGSMLFDLLADIVSGRFERQSRDRAGHCEA